MGWTCDKLKKREVVSDASNVTGKDILESQHNTAVIYLQNSSIPIYVDAMESTNLYNEIRKGDRIIKNGDELKCTLIRNLDTMQFSIRVSDCDPFIKQ